VPRFDGAACPRWCFAPIAVVLVLGRRTKTPVALIWKFCRWLPVAVWKNEQLPNPDLSRDIPGYASMKNLFWDMQV